MILNENAREICSLIRELDLVPVPSRPHTLDACGYMQVIELEELERIRKECDMRLFFSRNHKRKYVDVFETPSNQLSLPFE